MVDDADNVYFKRLLDLVPPHFYFNEEAKDMIRNKGKVIMRIIRIIMYIYHALINALSTHMIHINLNMIFHTHVEHSLTKQFK